MENKDPIRVIFFGDSICVGQGVSIHKGWVTRIAEEADELAAELDRDIVVVNASVSGDQTRQAIERMPYHVQSQRPHLLIVQFGMNDCNCWATDGGHPRVSHSSFAANLREIIARAVLFGVRRIVLHTNHPTSRTDKVMAGTSISYETHNQVYNDLIREVATKADERFVRLIDVSAAFMKEIDAGTRKREDLVLPDGLHLSRQGHELYYAIVGPVIQRELRELDAGMDNE